MPPSKKHRDLVGGAVLSAARQSAETAPLRALAAGWRLAGSPDSTLCAAQLDELLDEIEHGKRGT